MTGIDAILRDLRKGRYLTSYQAFTDFRVVDFRARVSDLRKRGWRIDDYYTRSSNGKRHKVYFIEARNRKGPK